MEYEFEKEKVQNTFRLEWEQLLVCVAHFFWTREVNLNNGNVNNNNDTNNKYVAFEVL